MPVKSNRNLMLRVRRSARSRRAELQIGILFLECITHVEVRRSPQRVINPCAKVIRVEALSRNQGIT